MGSQGYILTRKHTIKILEKYNINYLITANEQDPTFLPDWILTKYGNRALVYPMYFLEEGNITGDNWGQIKYHNDCFKFNYDKTRYI